MKKYAFGVDVGGTTCKIGLFETSGILIDKWEIRTNTENGGAAILSDAVAAVEAKLTEKGIGRDEVQGIGIGVPRPVREDGVVSRCVNLGWQEVHVAEELSVLTGFPVKAGNDANVAALGRWESPWRRQCAALHTIRQSLLVQNHCMAALLPEHTETVSFYPARICLCSR